MQLCLFYILCVASQATSSQQVVHCAVRWAAVSPLATDRHEHTLILVGDPEGNPDSMLMFGGCGEVLSEALSQLTGSLNVTINVVSGLCRHVAVSRTRCCLSNVGL